MGIDDSFKITSPNFHVNVHQTITSQKKSNTYEDTNAPQTTVPLNFKENFSYNLMK